MKKIVLFVLITLFIASVSYADTPTLKAMWEQPNIEDVVGWILHVGSESGVYTTHIVIPIAETELIEGVYTKSDPISLSQYSGQDVTLYFAVTAYDDALPEPNQSAYSNEVAINIDLEPPENAVNLIIMFQ